MTIWNLVIRNTGWKCVFGNLRFAAGYLNMEIDKTTQDEPLEGNKKRAQD